MKPTLRNSTLGRTGLKVSWCGFGGYRIDTATPDHRTALEKALQNGVTLLDTSTNYTDGESENLIGEVLSSTKLDQPPVVVTKVGYVQGQNMELVRQKEETGTPFSDVVKYSEDCWHCISPDFISDQISRSLKRLKRETLDVVLLHNPEYFLKSGGGNAEYYSRIQKALEHLESEVEAGRIHHYGISSNTFVDPKESEEFTSLEVILGGLKGCFGESHHFGVVQFPFNIFEPGAVLEKNNSDLSVFEFAEKEDLGILINRPLNAFPQDHFFRLADYPAHFDKPLDMTLRNTYRDVIDWEGSELVIPHIPRTIVPWGHVIQNNSERLSHIDTWNNVLTYQIRPQLLKLSNSLNDEGMTQLKPWFVEYEKKLEALFSSFTQYLEAHHHKTSQEISELFEGLKSFEGLTTLSQKSLAVAAAFSTKSCVLVGMRKPEYVDDVLAVTKEASLIDAQTLLERTMGFLVGENEMQSTKGNT